MSGTYQLVCSEIKCSNLRFYSPDEALVRRAAAILRFQLGPQRRKTAPHQKSAEPSWPQAICFDKLDQKFKNSTIRVEVWDYDPGNSLSSRPLGFVELSLSNLEDGVPYPFTGMLAHTEGCFSPPDRLPPMEIAMIVQLSSRPDTGDVTLSQSTKQAYAQLRDMFPDVSRDIIVAALTRNDFNVEKAMDHIAGVLQDEALETPKGRHIKSLTQSNFLSQGASALTDSFQNLKLQLGRPTHHGQKIPLQRNGLTHARGTLNAPGDDGRGYIDGVKREGRKKALLIGINYKGTKKELNGCHDDVERMRNLVCKLYGFPKGDHSRMTVLSDENDDTRLWPTRQNILLACQWLVHDAKPGDVLYFHFSGHGSQQQDLHGTETDGFDESIMPMDYKTKGHIVDDELFDALVKPLPSGVKLVALMDCCHSGTGLDLPFLWDIARNRWSDEMCPKYSEGDVILLSGCQDAQTSADVHIPKWGSGGAMTMSLVTTLSNNPYDLTVKELIKKVHNSMSARGLGQLPQLSTTQKFDDDRPFDFQTIKTNTNAMIGQDMSRSTNPTQQNGRTFIPKPLKGTAKKKGEQKSED